MAEFQWWLLIVGLVAGGGIVAVVSMEGRRREQDISELEQRAEATWIAERLARRGGPDPTTVESVLRAHRDYLSLQPPDRLIVEAHDDLGEYATQEPYGDAERRLDRDAENRLDRDAEVPLDRDADRQPDHVRDDGRGGADEDLAPAAEQRAAARQEAHAGADREQRRN